MNKLQNPNQYTVKLIGTCFSARSSRQSSLRVTSSSWIFLTRATSLHGLTYPSKTRNGKIFRIKKKEIGKLINSHTYMIGIRSLEVNMKTVLNVGEFIVGFAQHRHQITNCWVKTFILTSIDHLTLPVPFLWFSVVFWNNLLPLQFVTWLRNLIFIFLCTNMC